MTCLTGKLIYNKAAADRVARKLAARSGVQTYRYKCKHCGEYHLTKERPRK